MCQKGSELPASAQAGGGQFTRPKKPILGKAENGNSGHRKPENTVNYIGNSNADVVHKSGAFIPAIELPRIPAYHPKESVSLTAGSYRFVCELF